MRRALAAILVAWTGLWAVTLPAVATPPVPLRFQYLQGIENGVPEAARRGLGGEVAQVREQWLGALQKPGPRGLEHRLGYANELMRILSSWYTSEARALHEERSKDLGSALAVLDAWLPLAREVEEARTTYRAEAAALEPTLDPAERRSHSALFTRARWDDGDMLPLAAARLAKLCGSEAAVERVFESFGGRIGEYGDAAAYFRAPEDFYETLGLRERDARHRAREAALAPRSTRSEPGLRLGDRVAIGDLIGRFYAAVIERDADAVRGCLSPRTTQIDAILAGMRENSEIVRMGEIEKISFEPRPAGAVEVAVEKVAMTRRVGTDERIEEGSQTFIVLQENGEWKILEVMR